MAVKRLLSAFLLVVGALVLAPSSAVGQVVAIRAGRLVDPEAGTVAANQVILVENGRFTAIGPNLAISPA
jgi:imidazolonepropionase-like amidohydrolase